MMPVVKAGRRADPNVSPRKARLDALDLAATMGSLICLVHCVALPFLIMLLPAVLGLFVQSEAFHYVTLALLAPAAASAFYLGYRQHRSPWPPLLGVGGLTCIIVSILPGSSAEAELVLSIIGSVLLVSGHTLNWRKRAHQAA